MGIPAVQLVVVWVLSIVISSRLIETTLFMRKLFMQATALFNKSSKPDKGLQFRLGL